MEATSDISGEDFIFHNVHDNVYARRCYGMEALATNLQEAVEGMVILVTTAAVSIDSPPPREPFEIQVRAAWQLLRHLVPGIACQTSKLSPLPGQYELRYAVPQTLGDVGAWVNQTAFIDDSVAPMHERHEQLKNNRWWSSAEPHYNAELHVSPLEAPSTWQFRYARADGGGAVLLITHNSIDGRGAFALMELLFEFLTSVIEKRAQPTSEIKWGEEVARLTPPGPLILLLTGTGLPPDFPEALRGSLDHISARGSRYNVQGDLGYIVKFSPEVTAKLHAACKKHGRTITQVVSALLTLANAEASLKIAGQISDERYKDVLDGFSNSTHFLIAMNSICHTLWSYTLPMDAIRKLVKAEAAKKIVLREVNHDDFWGGLVNDVAAAWKAVDPSLEAYFTRQVGMHAIARISNPNMFDIVYPMISSIGDLSRLDLLNAYLPSATRKTLTVEDVIVSLRCRKPFFFTMCYQYNGQLSLHFCTAGEFATAESLKLVADIFEEWTTAIV
ncbi:hypothetical protein DFH11DRAFT_1545019 [Phellopilus nigrolimitatus]|nr:hypothetical protein DFH11DRAFT_1545019 [Phellopilus nigrolimitatus]